MAFSLTGQVQAQPTYDELSCKLGVLQDLGWSVLKTNGAPGISNGDACELYSEPEFTFNPSIETNREILGRTTAAIDSITTRCLVNRHYVGSVRTAITNLTNNKAFEFISGGADPRDPFIPPDDTWVASANRGYDQPARSLSESINTLYEKPFIAECAAATQIAQLAILKEHYGIFTDAMIQPSEVGIGIWQAYIKAPAIAAHKPLLLDSRQRKRALKLLAILGKGAFYNQSGYMRPQKGDAYVDSIDNRGQNFVIVDLTDEALQALRARVQPLKELNKISRNIWKKYHRRMTTENLDSEELREPMQEEFEKADPFFSDVLVYIHPLSVRNFAFHLARQFQWNPRTPYVFEIYEDFQSGYFHQRYVDYRLRQCQQDAYCRKADNDHYYLTDPTGLPDGVTYSSWRACETALEMR